MAALDADKNGELSAEEVANAATALKALDKNGDGLLSRDELRPPEFRGPRRGDGDRPRDGDRSRDGDRPRDGDGDRGRGRRPEGDRPPDGSRREGDRPDRPEGEGQPRPPDA
jgi:hypothetical protein